MADTGRIVSCLEPPTVISPLSVCIQSNGKKRLILDLRHVNTFLRKAHVKYEDWKIALSYFEKGAYMFSFDLKSGYHHVEIYEGHQTYLAFAWQCPSTGQMKFYKFTVLPFGLCTAPYIFTKLLKPLEKRWRYLGIRIAIFLDDGWVIEKDKPQCEHTSNLVKSDLASAGFLSNNEKSIWAPTQSLIWIGILWSTLEGTIALTPKRFEKICDTIQAIADAKFVISARQLASFTGQIISTGPIVGSVTRIMTRHCVLSTVAAEHWDKLISLDEYTKNELFFWRDNLSYLKTRHCFLHSTPRLFGR